MKAIIVAGGTPPSKKLLINEITANSIVIAADSGANCLFHHKIIPDYIIGDFDSIDKKVLVFFATKKIPIKNYPTNKDFTDIQLALKKALELKADKITFLGCLGGKRVDHLLGAFGLLTECIRFNIEANLKDDYQTVLLIKKSKAISGKPGDCFSLQAYGGPVKNLTITGSKYKLKNYFLHPGDALTISNVFQNKKINLCFTSGNLLVILNKRLNLSK